MEKNGNTFVPGDSVSQTQRAGNGKQASVATREGRVQSAASGDRVKVAWSDGTESWELPEDLNRG